MGHFAGQAAALMAAIVMAASILSGCAKVSHNGHLDGQWQVIEVSDGDTMVEFPEDERFYYCFYLHTFQLSMNGTRPFGFVGNMAYDEGTSLGLEFPYIKEGRVKEIWLKRLKYWGLDESGDAMLQIRQLTSGKLVMQRDTVTIVCRKF